MMPETVRELAAGNTVAVAQLVQLEFRSSTQRFWDGLNYLTAGGHQWQGAGKLISVSGLSQAKALTASSVTFTLAGTTPELINAAIDSNTDVTGQPCAVLIQFLSERYVPLDDPIALWSGTMDVLSFRGDVSNQTISLKAEGLFVNRIRAPYGYMTDPDQQARWPGDRGMEFMPELLNKTVPWLRG